jgi:uncharacterized protein YndB with AHSA1/START domain
MAAIKHLYHIQASKQEIFEAISTIEGLKNWWTADVTGDSQPGGIMAFRFNGGGVDFKVTELKENELVAWECVAGHADWIGTSITFYLDQNEGKTRIRFNHENWQETGDSYAACNFSWSRYLQSLRQLCQTGVGAAFGSKQYV